jgi:hypothetical protein
MRSHRQEVSRLALFPDGKTLASGICRGAIINNVYENAQIYPQLLGSFRHDLRQSHVAGTRGDQD